MKNSNNSKDLSLFVESLFEGLDSRHADVLRSRYGLKGGEGETLQAIGNRYKITRERVRQLEAAGLTLVKEKIDSPYFKEFIQTAAKELKAAGGVKREDHFFENLKKQFSLSAPQAVFANQARFMLELSGDFLSHRDNYGNDWHYHWYSNKQDRKKAQDFVLALESSLDKDKAEIVLGKMKFDEVLEKTARAIKLPVAVAKNYLAISKKFSLNQFNEFGPMSWSEIHPKTAKDWAYAVLKKEGRPLHFTKLSELIGKHRQDKRTNTQTVHNELIKDDRFVLVGRGMYGLKEAGLVPGIAREIITHVLKKNGPMTAREVIRLVSEQRFFKEGTILINLQNKKHFDCLPDGRYCLKA